MALHHIISNGLYKGIDRINDFTTRHHKWYKSTTPGLVIS